MTETIRPHTEDEVAAALADALAAEATVEIAGRGTKRGLGNPVAAARALDMSALTGITLYEPEELVLAARAATPLAEIKAALAERNQVLAFEPPDWGPLYGCPAGVGTLGGAVAANLSGPARIRNGAARDHVLGLRAVTGRGELVKTGGRVVKNVTGYDLCKLLTGSMGTLAALTEITVKVLPAPEKTRTVFVTGLDGAVALAAMEGALQSPHDVSGAAHLPAYAAARSAVSYVSGAGAGVTAIRIEGPAPSVAARCEAVKTLLAGFGPVEELHFHNSRTLWAEIGGGALLAGGGDPLWRISVQPTAGPRVGVALVKTLGAEIVADWGGGLLWARIPAKVDDAGEAPVRAAIARHRGHATLVRADDAVRARVPVFQPPAAGIAALNARIKAGFDPGGILNPGRMGEAA
jgi:glycolate oxidase FAD binding subunit